MANQQLNIGIIGCGKITQTRHAPEYAHNPEVTLIGFYDHSKDRANQLAQTYGGKAYDDLDGLLNDPKIDAVSVCVANKAHAEVAIKAMQAGKDVLCEKPMATTLEDCQKMVKTAAQTGRKLMIDQNQRFAKSHVMAKQLLNQGLIGDVLSFKTTFGHGGPETWSVDGGANTWFFNKQQSQYGAIFDLGVHKLDLMRYLLDSDVVNVTAKLATRDKRYADGQLIDVDDNAISIYQFDSGVLGTVTASWTYYGAEDNSTVLYGTKGIMRIYDDPKYSIKVTLKTGEHINYQLDQIQTNDDQTSSGVIDVFVDAVINQRSTVADADVILNSMKAVFGSVEADKLGKTVTIN